MKIQSIFNPIPILLMLSLSMMLLLLSASSGMATPSSSDELHLEQPVLSLEDEAENDSLAADESLEGVEVDVLLDSDQLAELPRLLNWLRSWQAEGKVSEFELVGQNRLRLFSDSSTIEALRALPTVSEVVASEEGSRSLSTADGILADFLPSREPFADSSRTLYAEGHDFLEQESAQGKQATEATREYWLILELNHPMKQLSAELSEALEHLKGEGMVLEVEPTLEESNILKVVATISAYSKLQQLPTVSAVALSAPLLSPGSRSHGEGTITGKVTAPDGTPLEDIRIWAAYREPNFGFWLPRRAGATNSEGEYTINMSESRIYRVGFYDPDDVYLSEYYDNASDVESATDIELIAGETIADINAQLDEGGHITGIVSDQNGDPIEEMDVTIYRYDEEQAQWRQARNTYTTQDGFYDASGLRSGTYRVYFEDTQNNYRSEFYDDVLDIEDGSDVTVVLGETTANIDASLKKYGRITGTVLNDEATPLPDIKVQVYQYRENSDYWARLNDDYTDAKGQYEIGGLDAGSYRVGFSDSTRDYLRQYYQNAIDVESATDVSVIASEITPNIDAQLQKAGHITGFVGATTSLPNPKPPTTNLGEHQLYLPLMLTAISNPLADIEVWAYQYNEKENRWSSKGQGETNTNGRYMIKGLHSGRYRLVFFDRSQRYLRKYYKDGAELHTALNVEVVAGQITYGINQLLDEAGKMTGFVTDANNEPLPNTIVYVYHYYDEGLSWREFDLLDTDIEGSYSIGGLEAGDYRLCFDSKSISYLSECYDEVSNFDSASTIEIILGETSPDINVTLDKGGEIHGTLTNSEGEPLPDIKVMALWHNEERDSSAWVRRTQTDENGQYQVKGLNNGTYRLLFDDEAGDYLPLYYGDTTDFNQATNLSVTIEETLTNIDAQLNDAGYISGVIRNAEGEVLTYAIAYAYRYNENNNQWEYINNDYIYSGEPYKIGGLDSGTYRVRLRDYFNDRLPEYYQDAADIESATDVSVIAGQTTTGIDGDLAEGGSITGVIRNPEGNPVGSVTVAAYQYNAEDEEWQEIRFRRTGSNGEYQIRGLNSGTYRLYTYDSGSRTYLSEYYDNVREIENATDIEIIVGQATGIEIELDRPAGLMGTVTNSKNEPLKDIRVYTYRYYSDAERWYRSESNYTNRQGEYEISYLRPGSYRVEFFSEEENYAPAYYQNASDFDSATTITVSANQTMADIDVQLAEGGQIRGIVTDADGQPLVQVEVRAYQYDDDEESWQIARSAYSNLYGQYEMEGLQTGNYRLGFFAYRESHVTQYYDKVSHIDQALDLSVTAGETISDINASLDKAGRIIGQISSTNGGKLGGSDSLSIR